MLYIIPLVVCTSLMFLTSLRRQKQVEKSPKNKPSRVSCFQYKQKAEQRTGLMEDGGFILAGSDEKGFKHGSE